MFGSLKEKIGNWIKKSKEKLEKIMPEKEAEEVKSREDTSKSSILKELKSQKSKISEKPLGVVDKEAKPEKKKEKLKQKPEKKSKKKKKQAFEHKPELEELEKEVVKEIPKTIKEAEQEIKEVEEKAVEFEEVIKEEEEPKNESFFSRIKSRLSYKITENEFNEIFDDLEMLLLENNVALEVVEDIKKKLSEKLIGKEISKKELETEIKKGLKNSLNEILIDPDDLMDTVKLKKEKPFVILFFGINGTGKTTSIAKLAYLLKKNNFSVVLAAADTFRAASIEQIAEHADKLKVHLIKQDYGADPSAVGFDAIKYAEKNKIDVVLIDTAGRMHTKTNLINEMEKICRVTNPDLKIFVAESIAGNDATEQAKTFNEAIEIDGSILSKADVDDKGGTIISVSHATHKPIFYLGTGQKYSDLELFDKKKFIDSLGL